MAVWGPLEAKVQLQEKHNKCREYSKKARDAQEEPGRHG